VPVPVPVWSEAQAFITWMLRRWVGILLKAWMFVDCRLLVVMGRDFVSALQPLWLIALSPDESECDWVSERDRLGLAPNLTTRDSGEVENGQGNENFVYSSLWGFKSSFTCRKILRHGTFPLYFPSERKMCCGFVSPLKIQRLGRVRTHKLWVQLQAH
jgi:hypothetical protein